MSHDDPFRSDPRDRGPYTPPDSDDELPFDRQSYGQGYDARRGGRPTGGGFDRYSRGGGRKSPPITLIISGIVLLALIAAVAAYYMRSGLRASEDAPGVGREVGEMTTAAPLDAQPIDPEAGIDVYGSGQAPTAEAPTFVPPPEAVQPRPEPSETPVPLPPVETAPAPKAATPTTPTAPVVVPVPAKRPTPAPAPEAADPAPAASGGSSSVQIGAFSTPSTADIEFGVVRSRFPQLTQGAGKRVQEVPGPNGQTLYRTSVTNLSREQADRLCSAIQGRGGSCIVR